MFFGGNKMIVIMKKGARKSEINNVLKIVGNTKSFISKIDGRKIIVVK